MKYEKVKQTVARNVYEMIMQGRDSNIMATILMDKLLGDKPKSPCAHKTFKEYADFACNIIDNWDIRCVGKLREIFPFFPPSLQKGDLICDYDEDGDWCVYVK